MRLELLCPACGIRAVDFNAFKSTILLAPNLAMMQFDCPVCQTPLQVTVKLSRTQQRQLQALLRTRSSFSGPDSSEAQASFSTSASVDGSFVAAEKQMDMPEYGRDNADDQLMPPSPIFGKTQICYSAPLVVDTRDDILQILLAPPTTTPEARLRIQEFHEQLERVASVDDALAQIDARHRPPRF